ncbi:MAG: hypothetical protein ACLTV6_14455 [Christensenellales bacterium]
MILHYRQRAGSIMASFARNAKWCDCYVQVCARLHDVAQSLPDGAAKAALNKRVGQIALSVGKIFLRIICRRKSRAGDGF